MAIIRLHVNVKTPFYLFSHYCNLVWVEGAKKKWGGGNSPPLAPCWLRACTDNLNLCMYEYMGHSKSNEICQNFRTSENFGSRRFRLCDSKSESWHRAKNSRIIDGQPIPPPHFSRNGKSYFYLSALFNNYKN